MWLTLLAAVSALIWLSLAFARGGFWRLRTEPAPAASTARVVAVIPARDEAKYIGDAVRSLLQSSPLLPLHVIVVDDASVDGTAGVAQETARKLGCSDRLSVLTGRALPAGWTGKLWALTQGVQQARALQPDFLLLTDADIRHSSDNLARLAGRAEAGPYDLVSYMVRLNCSSFAERALIPAFVFFFFMLYPPRWIKSSTKRTAGAAGGCILVRPAVLDRMGGLEAIRNSVIDDCALAAAAKRNGGRLWLELTSETASIRPYASFREIGRIVERTAFTQLNHSGWLLAATVLGLLLIYVVPVTALIWGSNLTRLLGGLAWLLMTICYLPMVRFYKTNPLWSFCLPAVSIVYLGATVRSALAYWRGAGGRWKGRVQDTRPPRLDTN